MHFLIIFGLGLAILWVLTMTTFGRVILILILLGANLGYFALQDQIHESEVRAQRELVRSCAHHDYDTPAFDAMMHEGCP